MKNLEMEILKLRSWDQKLDASAKVAEWECEYEDWASLNEAFNLFVDQGDFRDLRSNQLDEILYLIARDNESETIMDKCKENVSLFETLLGRLPHSLEAEAKWQFAEAIPKLISDKVRAENILVSLVQDKHEYTSRRALMSLSRIGSDRTEEFCEIAWDSALEYQRITALWALKEMQSLLLPEYIRRGLEDGREYVVRAAKNVAAAAGSQPFNEE